MKKTDKEVENRQKEAISNLLKRIQKKNNWTQKDLGELLGVSSQSIHAYKAMERLPKPDIINKIFYYVHLDPSEFDFICDTDLWFVAYPTEIGRCIRSFRQAREMTQEELGQKLGISKAMVSSYETGKRNPKISTLNRIAEALQVSLDELISNDSTKYIRREAQPDNPNMVKFVFWDDPDVPEPLPDEDWYASGDEDFVPNVDLSTISTHKYSQVIDVSLDEQYNLLNSEGQRKVCEYIRDLLSIPAYQRRETICQEQQKTQVPSESEQTEPGKQE